jgi:predicted nucleotidyltransferase
MQRDHRAFLWDVREAALSIQTFTTGLDVTAYQNNELVQAAVERKFEVIGEALSQQRDAVCQTAARHRVANPRAFGSALHGRDVEGSDLDLLVDPLPGTTLFDLGGLQDELQTLLGVSVNVLTPKDLPPKFRDAVVQEARPL